MVRVVLVRVEGNGGVVVGVEGVGEERQNALCVVAAVGVVVQTVLLVQNRSSRQCMQLRSLLLGKEQ